MEALWSHYGAEPYAAVMEMERQRPLWSRYGVTMGRGRASEGGGRTNIRGARGGARRRGPEVRVWVATPAVLGKGQALVLSFYALGLAGMARCLRGPELLGRDLEPQGRR